MIVNPMTPINPVLTVVAGYGQPLPMDVWYALAVTGKSLVLVDPVT